MWTIQIKNENGEWIDTTYNTFNSSDAEKACYQFHKKYGETRIIFNSPWHKNDIWGRSCMYKCNNCVVKE